MMRFMMCVAYIMKQRCARLAVLRRTAALAAGVAAVEVACADVPVARQHIDRALGGWRGSTVSGYLRGADKTLRQNFRCGQVSLNDVCVLLSASALKPKMNLTLSHVLSLKSVKVSGSIARTAKALLALDKPTLRYKVACCLYVVGHGGPVKVLADACSVGVSTLRKWLRQFAEGVMKFLKPVYMPAKPMDSQTRDHVQQQFASRRGIPGCVLACDGTHVPFHPKNKKTAQEYKNYKGWNSILGVAFVDSFYRFFEMHVGYPGRAGDNTVLNHFWLMKAIKEDPNKWLGPNGLILADSGASDGDNFFINPYHNPMDADKNYFNFCHSSTRFFVEQTFGIWKSRFRFLLNPIRVNHKLTTQLIYATCVLHNMFVERARDDVSLDPAAPHWASFFKNFKAHLCPQCKREQKQHCLHQVIFRQGPAQLMAARRAPSVVRDELCEKLWQRVCDMPQSTDKENIQQHMLERATTKQYRHGI